MKKESGLRIRLPWKIWGLTTLNRSFLLDQNLIKFCVRGIFPTLTEEELAKLDRTVTDEEISNALFSMKGWKAPGPDGIPAAFFQIKWELVKESICNWVKQIFQKPEDIETVNRTFISLIPKVESPESFFQFRPISLCNVIYKLVTKVLASRIKKVMNKLVNQAQSSFVPGRQATDNILVAQEVVHTMRNKKGRNGFMAVKVDLEKAYDRLNWEFIVDTLKDIGLPSRMITLIEKCISSAEMNLLWNGSPSESFHPTRGIRQGDPISPYIFVLCIEKLAQLISLAVKHKLWEPIQLSRNEPELSHLCFADDLVLFAKASLDQVNVIKGILDLFCKSSGQKVNQGKSCIFFSKNVSHTRRQEISEAIGFHMMANIGKYLSVPLLQERLTAESCQFIIDRMNQRLSGWKVTSLSLAGRVTLTRSALATIPSYVMQTMLLPVSVVKKIDQICRSFVWGSTTEKR